MIPADVRLFSWVDVEQVLTLARDGDGWPVWLRRARAYWDGLTLEVAPGTTQEEIDAWLEETFEPRYSREQSAILLESLSDQERLLPVSVEELEEIPEPPRFRPTWEPPNTLAAHRPRSQPEPFESDIPPIMAFHSFKGGVGRTVHALALVASLRQRFPGEPVLLIDGDFEAPGLTWLLKKRLPQIPVSFLDFLTLVHGDASPNQEEAIRLTADALQSALLENVYVLPTFRVASQMRRLEVRPEHLTRFASDPFILSNAIGRLGRELGVKLVIVDLRAGFSELAAGLLLDPRVHRILVTTLSAQSLQGTEQILETLGELAPLSRADHPLPGLIITQIPQETEKDRITATTAQLFDYLYLLNSGPRTKPPEGASSYSPTTYEPAAYEDAYALRTYFRGELQVLPGDWDEVMALLATSGVTLATDLLLNELPTLSPTLPPIKPDELSELRHGLLDLAGRLMGIKNEPEPAFLTPRPIQRLASQTRLPVALVSGAPLSGKTYYFMELVRQQNWRQFVEKHSGLWLPAPDFTETDTQLTLRRRLRALSERTCILPVTIPGSLTAGERVAVEQAREATRTSLGLSASSAELKVLLSEFLDRDLSTTEWRDTWWDIIAWMAGMPSGEAGAGRRLVVHLRNVDHKLVALFDGLDECFPDPHHNVGQQRALYALLRELPTLIEKLPRQNLGIIIFVPTHLVTAALGTEAADWLSRFEPYALRWAVPDTLRLAAWATGRVLGDPKVEKDSFHDLEVAALSARLRQLWGFRLGPDRSSAPRAERWITVHLADAMGRIQPRDMLRFLKFAAETSIGDERWLDRLLTPPAIYAAVSQCGKERLADISRESPQISALLERLRALPEDKRVTPVPAEELPLTTPERELLRQYGLLAEEGESVILPPLFQEALGFTTGDWWNMLEYSAAIEP